MLGLLIREGTVDEQFIALHTSGWNSVRDAALAWTPQRAARECGIPAEMIVEAGHMFVTAQRPLSLWSMGVNQSSSGTAKALAIVNLHLATGTIGKPGCGPFRPANPMRWVAGKWAGWRICCPVIGAWTIRSIALQVAQFWDVPVERISPRPGLSAIEMFEAVAEGRVKALWIVATNPAVSMPDLDLVERALR